MKGQGKAVEGSERSRKGSDFQTVDGHRDRALTDVVSSAVVGAHSRRGLQTQSYKRHSLEEQSAGEATSTLRRMAEWEEQEEQEEQEQEQEQEQTEEDQQRRLDLAVLVACSGALAVGHALAHERLL